jgi:uncharacterized protein (DUF488 family)
MVLYTIGSGKKSAEIFFSLLKENDIKRVIDVRLNNTSQLAGYTKKADLEYFLEVITHIDYLHLPELAPTEQLLENYKSKKISWVEYEKEYDRILSAREPFGYLNMDLLNRACFLCSEPTAKQCHRRLLAEFLKKEIPDLEIIHL